VFLAKFRYRHCCVSVTVRPSGSDNAALWLPSGSTCSLQKFLPRKLRNVKRRIFWRFWMSSEIISFLIKKVDMHSKMKTYGSPTQCYSYITCANLSKANARSTSNEYRDLNSCVLCGLALHSLDSDTWPTFRKAISAIVVSSHYQIIY